MITLQKPWPQGYYHTGHSFCRIDGSNSGGGNSAAEAVHKYDVYYSFFAVIVEFNTEFHLMISCLVRQERII